MALPSAPSLTENPPAYDSIVQGDNTQAIHQGQKVHSIFNAPSHLPNSGKTSGGTQSRGISDRNIVQSGCYVDTPLERFRTRFTPEQQEGILNCLNRHEVQGSSWLAYRLAELKSYGLDFIVDNSASMNIRDGMKNPRSGTKMSRIEEAKYRMALIAELISFVPVQEISIRSLSQSDRPIIIYTDQAPEHIQQAINNAMKSIVESSRCSSTPLLPALKNSMREVQERNFSRILYVFNDGEPNELDGLKLKSNVEAVKTLLKTRAAEKYPVCLLACTDQEDSIGWMNETDDYPRIHVVDDFEAEKAEVLANQGKNFPFTEGFYLLSALLGPIDDLFDKADEKHIYDQCDYQEILGDEITNDQYRRYVEQATRLQKGYRSSPSMCNIL